MKKDWLGIPLSDRKLNMRGALYLTFTRWNRLYRKQKRAYAKMLIPPGHTIFSFFVKRAINIYRRQLGETITPGNITISGVYPNDKIRFIPYKRAK